MTRSELKTDAKRSPLPAADRSTIHLWSIDIEPPDRRLGALRAVLSDKELARAERFKFEEHRRRWITRRAMLRTILSGFTKVEPAALEFTYETNGKPYLATDGGGQPLHFNLSHSGNVALLAVTAAAPVGIDVERVKPLKDINSVIGRFFSKAEQDAFRGLTDEERRLNAFYACWTRKEAYLKAIGCGIFQPTDSFDVTFLPDVAPAIEAIDGDRCAAKSWLLFALQVKPGYVGALAIRAQRGLELVWHDAPPV